MAEAVLLQDNVSGRTVSGWLRTRDTVAGETPAISAIEEMDARLLIKLRHAPFSYMKLVYTI